MVSAAVNGAESTKKSLEQLKSEAKLKIFQLGGSDTAAAASSTSDTLETSTSAQFGGAGSPDHSSSNGLPNGAMSLPDAPAAAGFSQNGLFVGATPENLKADKSNPSLPPPDVAKTIPCRFFPNCKYGNDCAFAHVGTGVTSPSQSIPTLNGGYVGGFYYPNSPQFANTPQFTNGHQAQDPHASQGGMPVPIEFTYAQQSATSPRPAGASIPQQPDGPQSPSAGGYPTMHMPPFYPHPFAAATRMQYPVSPAHYMPSPYYSLATPMQPVQRQNSNESNSPANGVSSPSPNQTVPLAPKAHIHAHVSPKGNQNPTFAQPAFVTHPSLATTNQNEMYYSSPTFHHSPTSPTQQSPYPQSLQSNQTDNTIAASGFSSGSRHQKRSSLSYNASSHNRQSSIGGDSALPVPNRPPPRNPSSVLGQPKRDFPYPISKVNCNFFTSSDQQCRNGDSCPFAHPLSDGTDAKSLQQGMVNADRTVGDPAQLAREQERRKNRLQDRGSRDRQPYRQRDFSDFAPGPLNRGRMMHENLTLPGGKANNVSRHSVDRQRVPDTADFPALAAQPLTPRTETPSGSASESGFDFRSPNTTTNNSTAPTVSFASAAARGASVVSPNRKNPALRPSAPAREASVARSPAIASHSLPPHQLDSPVLTAVSA